MGGGDHEITRAKDGHGLARAAHFPSGSTEPPHTDHFTFPQGQVDEWRLHIGIVLVFPLQVGSIQGQIRTPMMCLELHNLAFELIAISNYSVSQAHRMTEGYAVFTRSV